MAKRTLVVSMVGSEEDLQKVAGLVARALESAELNIIEEAEHLTDHYGLDIEVESEITEEE